jgi:4-amino-4-deoxy-L-arabinose transferase-like glycosyltransferase
VRHKVVLVALLVGALVPYFVGLGDSPIWDANEAFYAGTPREMIARGDWLNPTFNDRPRFNKPPLSYWVVALAYRLFGESVAVERAAIAVGALVLVVAAGVVAREVFGGDAGLVAAIAVATAPRVLMWARRIFIDIWVTMFIAVALMAFVLAERRPEARRRWLSLMYVAVGLGTLTKGPVAIVLPGLAFATYLGVCGRWRGLRDLMLPAGALIVAAIVAPWYAALYAQHGWTYIREFFLTENVSRYLAPYGEPMDRGLFFYLPVVATDLFPWTVYLPAALAFFAARGWRARRERSGAASASALGLLLVVWVVVIVGFFSLSQTKQDLYIFPTIVAIAALAGGLVAGDDRAGEPARRAALARGSTVVLGVALVGAGAAVLLLFASPARVYQLEGVAPVGAIAIASGAATAVLAARRHPRAAVAVVAAAFVAIAWIFVLQTLPSFARYQPVPNMAAIIRARAEATAVVGYYKVGLPSLSYYLRRPVAEWFDPQPGGEGRPALDQLAEAVASGRGVYVLIAAREYEAIKDRLPAPTCVLARAPLFNAKIGSVLARRPLPELLLVTDRCE